MILKKYELLSGGNAVVTEENMLFSFDRPRTVLSTSEYLGGLNKLSGVFNQKLPRSVVSSQDLPGGSVRLYFAKQAQMLGDTNMSCLLTSARMACHARHALRTEGIAIEVFATGGVFGNAARAGEPARYKETAEGFSPLGGTINLFVFFSFALSPGLMAKALITLTEAKSALLQELGIYSVFDSYTATGTSTDGAIIVMNDEGPLYNDVGTYSQIGSMLAMCTKEAIAKTLHNECYINETSQMSAALLLKKLAQNKAQKDFYFAKFADLSIEEKAELLEALSIWRMISEKHAFGGLSDRSFAMLKENLCLNLPVIKEFINI